MSSTEKNNNKIKAWIGAFRLRTLPLSFSCILMGSSLAYYENMMSCEGGSWNYNVFYLTLLTTLFLQVLSNLANDYGDAKKGADNEGRIGPERAVQSGAISVKAMLGSIYIFSLLSLASGTALLLVAFENELNLTFLTFFFLGIAAIAAAIKYTVGKGAYGYTGFGDFFVIIFFGLIGVMGTAFLQLHWFDSTYTLPAMTIGLLSAAVLNLNNMRDQVNDKAVGKNTLVVKLGFTNAKKYHYFLFFTAYTCLFLYLAYTERYQLMAYVSPVILIQAIHIRKVVGVTEPKEFDPELKKVALTTFLLSLIIFVSSLYQV